MISLSSAVALDITVFLLCIVALFRFARLTATHPGATYLIFHLLVVTSRLLAVRNGAPTLFSIWYGPVAPVTPDEMARAGLLADLGLVSMTAGWIVAYQRGLSTGTRASTPGHPLRIRLIRAVAFVTIPVGVVALLFSANLPGGLTLEANLGAWNSSSYITMTQSWAGLGLIGLIYWYGFNPLLMSGMAMYLSVMAYQGHDRFRVVIIIILLVQIYLDRRGLRWPTKKMFVLLVMTAVLFFPLKKIGNILQQGRGWSEVEDTIFSDVREVSTGEHGDQVILDEFAASVSGADVNGKLFLGQTYAGLLTVPIPRQWWPEKPGLADQMTAISSPARPLAENGMVTTMLGEFYLNFSYAGIVVMSFLFALYSGRWFNAAYRNGYFSVEHFLYLLVACNLLQIYRDGLISLFVFTVINMLPLTVMGALHFFLPLRSLSPAHESATTAQAEFGAKKAAARAITEADARMARAAVARAADARMARAAIARAKAAAEAATIAPSAKTETDEHMPRTAAQAEAEAAKAAAIAAEAGTAFPRESAIRANAEADALQARDEAIREKAAALALVPMDAAARAKAEASALQAHEEAKNVKAEAAAAIARESAMRAKAEADAANAREEFRRLGEEADTRVARETKSREKAEADVLKAREEVIQAKAEADRAVGRERALRAEAEAEAGKAREEAAQIKLEAHAAIAREIAIRTRAEADAIRAREEAIQAQAARLKTEEEAAAARAAAARATAETETARARQEILAKAEVAALAALEAANLAKQQAYAAREAARTRAEAKARAAREPTAQAKAEAKTAKAATLAREQADALKAREAAEQAQAEAASAIEAECAQAEADAHKAREAADQALAEAEAAKEAERAKVAAASAVVAPAAAAAFSAAAIAPSPPAAGGSVAASAYQFLDLEAARIRYRTAGAGHQLLLLHEWGSSIESMNGVFDALASTYAVVAMDFPGHGQSGEPPHALVLKDFADCVLSVMDHLHLTDPHVLAHAFGGSVAVQLAHDHPERVAKLVLENTGTGVTASTGSSAGAPLKNRFSRLFKSGPETTQTGTISATLEKVRTANLTAILPSVMSETLLIYGENDAAAAQADQMKGLIPRSEVVSLKNAGHVSHSEQSAMFLLVTKRFLRDGTLGPAPTPRG